MPPATIARLSRAHVWTAGAYKSPEVSEMRPPMIEFACKKNLEAVRVKTWGRDFS